MVKDTDELLRLIQKLDDHFHRNPVLDDAPDVFEAAGIVEHLSYILDPRTGYTQITWLK